MTFKQEFNYTVLVNNCDANFLKKFATYMIIDEGVFEKLKERLEMFPSRQVVFNEAWYNLLEQEKKQIFALLNLQKIGFINITSNIEDVLYSDYVYVYDNDNLIMEGFIDEVLKNEKKLQELGYGLPFVVELSKKLNYYDVLNKTYYDMKELVDILWN